ncbi:IclR family transcriptional regulator [Agromyces mediolanus]|uniref:IclR family transcriptional regulator n=1 Tax=Agromyces mediolanus TaxID=41986 RepID=UPI0020404B55|nr:IclR family transcriptional regulator [Agromyces mediolanus]MCM3658710.1 IclR family transcriptional regulator [Agromyces mediolanus]
MTEQHPTAPAPRNNSSSLRRALAILLQLGEDRSGEGYSLAELGELLQLNKSTILRLMQPMIEEHFIEAGDSQGHYRLSWRSAQLGQSYLNAVSIDRDMHDVLIQLSRASQETTHLVRAALPRVVYIDKVDSPLAVRMFSRVGNTQPMYSTSVGKAILAQLDEAAVHAVLEAGMPRRTPRTITDEAALRHDLALTRERGWAIDDVENEDGIRCVAAPVFDQHGQCSHAISLSGPVSRVTSERVPELSALVVASANEISRRLGARR